MTDLNQLKQIVEGALLAAGRPLDIQHIEALFEEDQCPEKDDIRQALEEVAVDCAGRGFELKKVGSGYRFQVRQELSQWINRLWEEKPQRYSRAVLETLSLIAYRQPITRGDIEEIRGVSVSSQIIKTLLEREWVRVVGHRDVPGRPSLYATTRQFLDYFNLSSLDELPPLGELRDIDEIDPEMELDIGDDSAEATEITDQQQSVDEDEEVVVEEGSADTGVDEGDVSEEQASLLVEADEEDMEAEFPEETPQVESRESQDESEDWTEPR
ncbi:SMC-Scp complex subunit ScpB [Porticoccaceae bacterium LTM1]|nr:SMC-Scp complex subunit ScpB [Porticoccaceae bacterium LTM1]